MSLNLKVAYLKKLACLLLFFCVLASVFTVMPASAEILDEENQVAEAVSPSTTLKPVAEKPFNSECLEDARTVQVKSLENSSFYDDIEISLLFSQKCQTVWAAGEYERNPECNRTPQECAEEQKAREQLGEYDANNMRIRSSRQESKPTFDGSYTWSESFGRDLQYSDSKNLWNAWTRMHDHEGRYVQACFIGLEIGEKNEAIDLEFCTDWIVPDSACSSVCEDLVQVTPEPEPELACPPTAPLVKKDGTEFLDINDRPEGVIKTSEVFRGGRFKAAVIKKGGASLVTWDEDCKETGRLQEDQLIFLPTEMLKPTKEMAGSGFFLYVADQDVYNTSNDSPSGLLSIDDVYIPEVDVIPFDSQAVALCIGGDAFAAYGGGVGASISSCTWTNGEEAAIYAGGGVKAGIGGGAQGSTATHLGFANTSNLDDVGGLSVCIDTSSSLGVGIQGVICSSWNVTDEVLTFFVKPSVGLGGHISLGIQYDSRLDDPTISHDKTCKEIASKVEVEPDLEGSVLSLCPDIQFENSTAEKEKETLPPATTLKPLLTLSPATTLTPLIDSSPDDESQSALSTETTVPTTTQPSSPENLRGNDIDSLNDDEDSPAKIRSTTTSTEDQNVDATKKLAVTGGTFKAIVSLGILSIVCGFAIQFKRRRHAN